MLGLKRPRVAVMGLRGFPGIQGGVEKHSEAIYSRMREFSFNVFRRRPYVNKNIISDYSNITFIDYPSTKIKGFETVFHTLMSSMRTILLRPSLVHVHNIGPGIFIPLFKMFRLKVVMTYHSPNYEHNKWNRIARILLKFGESVSLRFSDKVIFVNRNQYSKFMSKYPDKCVYIPNGVTHHEPSVSDDYVRSLGLEHGKYILGVGRLSPEKGFEYLVDAVNRLEDDVRLVIAGGCDNGDAYLHKLKLLDKKCRTVFPGHIFNEDLNQIYDNAALFVLPSLNEGFPLVLLEAMDHRLPIIASDIPGARLPMLDEDCFFKPGDVDGLVVVLQKKLSNLANHTPKDYDISAYNWDVIAHQTSEVYKSILQDTIS